MDRRLFTAVSPIDFSASSHLCLDFMLRAKWFDSFYLKSRWTSTIFSQYAAFPAYRFAYKHSYLDFMPQGQMVIHLYSEESDDIGE
ncbi:hypothetical protein AVEN_20339-1 [Araneus ventricosus]|uniref:Uncharacterized protein n=1 Tax=Araneus ventricosus TaxID=182803 RepID=A0A4Y2IPD1_ARAVE|nr:hypothetical protein AVEN_20339-1 [Araneus ventricosus]